MRAANALASLSICTGSPEPSLLEVPTYHVLAHFTSPTCLDYEPQIMKNALHSRVVKALIRLVSVEDDDIAPMNPYQPIPFHILSYVNIPV